MKPTRFWGVDPNLNAVLVDEKQNILAKEKHSNAESLKDSLKHRAKEGRIAFGVTGDNAFVRVFKIPPIAKEKLSGIVVYEAKQQIPFDLNDVNWDWCKIGGRTDEKDFFVLDASIYLEAITKRRMDTYLEVLKRTPDIQEVRFNVIQSLQTVLTNYLFEKFGVGLLSAGITYGVVYKENTGTTLVFSNGSTVWTRTFQPGEPLTDTRVVDFCIELQRSCAYYKALNGGNFSKLVLLGQFSDEVVAQVKKAVCFEVSNLTTADKFFTDAIVDNDVFSLAHQLALRAADKCFITTNLMPHKEPFDFSKIWERILEYIPRVTVSFPHRSK